MSKPTTPFIKRAQLYEWLETEGLPRHAVKDLLASKTIPRRIFPGRIYARYSVAAVANALQLPNPLNPTRQ